MRGFVVQHLNDSFNIYIFQYLVLDYLFLLSLSFIRGTYITVKLSEKIGVFLTRIGCFLNGCDFGRVTSLSWGVRFAKGSIPYRWYLKSGIII